MRIVVLGSGSGGNCSLIEAGRTRILVDAGFGKRSVRRRLSQAGLPSDRVDAVLLTHGHSDHVRGLESLLDLYQCPVFMNEGTRDEVARLSPVERFEAFEEGSPFAVGDFQIDAFPVPHDANQPVGFRFMAGGVTGIYATDLGRIPEVLVDRARGADWMILESNHDEDLLRFGPYPWQLKRRVLSKTGHLSNRSLASFLSNTYDGTAAHLFLAHLSRQNNIPELALDSVSVALQERGFLSGRTGLCVHLTHQSKPSIVVRL